MVHPKSKRGIKEAAAKGKKKAGKGKKAPKSSAKSNPQRPTMVSPQKTQAVEEEEEEKDASEQPELIFSTMADSSVDPRQGESDIQADRSGFNILIVQTMQSTPS